MCRIISHPKQSSNSRPNHTQHQPYPHPTSPTNKPTQTNLDYQQSFTRSYALQLITFPWQAAATVVYNVPLCNKGAACSRHKTKCPSIQISNLTCNTRENTLKLSRKLISLANVKIYKNSLRGAYKRSHNLAHQQPTKHPRRCP